MANTEEELLEKEAVEAQPSDSETAEEAGSETAEEETGTDSVSEETETPQEEIAEEPESSEEKHKFSVSKKTAAAVSVALGALILVYFAGVRFYSNHFFFGTKIGNFECSNLTKEEAEKKIADGIENYSFTYHEKNGETEVISGSDIGLQHSPVGNIGELMNNQNAFKWFLGSWGSSYPLNIDVTFDNDALYEKITETKFARASKESVMGERQNIYYENGQYHIRDNGKRDIVSVNEIYDKTVPKIEGLYFGMNMEQEGCYHGIEAQDLIKRTLKLANDYVSAKITYKRGDEKSVLDGGTIKEWVSINEDFSVKLSEEKIKEYVAALADRYNTRGRTRKFKTSEGKTIDVGGGDYGWLVDTAKEENELTWLIKTGADTEREPFYKQTAAAHGTDNDLAGTYVEINLSAQKLWFYKNHELIVSSDFVSGNPLKNNATPTGMYYVKYKDKNVVLKGQGYESPVTFWMPFNGGVGLHDAPWRGSFGGAIYRGGGSHGCINLPYSAAQKIYQSISPGDPVIVF